jgi:hypothetical protein
LPDGRANTINGDPGDPGDPGDSGDSGRLPPARQFRRP